MARQVNPPDENSNRDPQLRAAAERQLADNPQEMPPASSAEEMLHELQVQQIELEMQNETLRRSQIELEAARDRYADLYDFSPIGYLTLDSHGMIAEINLTCAAMLGVERKRLLRRRLASFVIPSDHDIWTQHFLNMKKRNEGDSVELSLRRSNGLVFQARLDCVPEFAGQHAGSAGVGAGDTAIRVAVSDISEKASEKQSTQNFRAIFERSPIGIGIAGTDRRYRMVNPAMCRMLGYSETELLGMKFTDVTHPDDVRLNVWNVEGLDAGEASHFAMEKRYIRKDGEIVWVSLNVVAVKGDSGRESYTVGLTEDITARKQAEEQRLTDAREQRDTLVREVHHRIKNNLQSVAGLLQRELGQFLELDPRLEAAISQVNAIAVVHGLQSMSPDEAINLCESIKSICASIANLSQRPVLFRLENQQAALCPVRVATGEAVSMALVINELILNAVKHSPPDGAAPIASLSVNDQGAQLRIRNVPARTPAFNIDTGKGLGTGLRLVRSLLPGAGAQLTYRLDDENLLLTRLNLSAPILVKPDSPP